MNIEISTSIEGNSYGLINHPFSELFIVQKIESNLPCRIRFYLSELARENDLSRLATEQINGNHGCFFDIQVNGVRQLNPIPTIYLEDKTGYLAVENLSSEMREVNLKFTLSVIRL